MGPGAAEDDSEDNQAVCYGPVGHCLPQTAPAAEHAALSALARLATPRTVGVLDCKMVVDAFLGGTDAMLSHKRMYAGVFREAMLCSGWKHIEALAKVKAHQDLSRVPAEDRIARRRAVANDFADHYAKLAARSMHPAMDADKMQKSKDAVDEACVVARVLAEASELWPAAKRGSAEDRRKRLMDRKAIAAAAAKGGDDEALVMDAADSRRGGHRWTHRAGYWRCSVCLTMAQTDATKARRSTQICHGSSKMLRGLIADHRGHHLRAAHCNPVFVYCCTCGSFMSKKPVNLLRPCRGFPTAGGKRALRFIADGLHPVHAGVQIWGSVAVKPQSEGA